MDQRFEQRQAPAIGRRQRRMCILEAREAAPAAIRTITARGAFLETNERPPLGFRVTLRHPDAGMISGDVNGVAGDGISVAFACDARAAGFALGVIAADMSRPAA